MSNECLYDVCASPGSVLLIARRRRAPHMSLILLKISSSCPESGCLFDLT